jgi:predicted nuclease of predicted toxin-antitoxin system
MSVFTGCRTRKCSRKPDAEQRVIVTIDLDFGEILSFSGGKIISTITFRVHNTRGDFLIRRLDAVLPSVLPHLERGAIVIIEDARYRVRPLPITSAGSRDR